MYYLHPLGRVKRNGSWHQATKKEGEDSNHGQSSVLELLVLHLVGNISEHKRVDMSIGSVHVMLSENCFGQDLDDSRSDENLDPSQSRSIGHGSPRIASKRTIGIFDLAPSVASMCPTQCGKLQK
jgi:hypothetical protein